MSERECVCVCMRGCVCLCGFLCVSVYLFVVMHLVALHRKSAV